MGRAAAAGSCALAGALALVGCAAAGSAQQAASRPPPSRLPASRLPDSHLPDSHLPDSAPTSQAVVGAAPSGAAAFPHRAVVGPTLRISPTSGPYGTVIHVSGTVIGLRDCPAVRVTLGADAATGAASGGGDAVVRLDPSGADRGGYALSVRLPGTRLTGRSGPPVLRASCERLDHHATNVGDEPVVAFGVTG